MAKSRRRRRRLADLKIGEVSLVDRPANLTPFLFVKSDDGDIVEKAFRGLDVSFSTKGTPDDTVLKINGKEIDQLKWFGMSFQPMGSEDISLSANYTVGSRGQTANGFTSSRSFSLTKNDDGTSVVEESGGKKTSLLDDTEVSRADDEDYEVIKSYMPSNGAPEWIDAEIAKALVPHLKTVQLYQDDLPPELEEAIQAIVKVCTSVETEEVAEEKTMTQTKKEDSNEEQNQDQEPIDYGKLAAEVAPIVTESVMAGIDARDKKTEEDRVTAETAANQEQKGNDNEDDSASGEVEVDAGEFGQEVATAVAAGLSGDSSED